MKGFCERKGTVSKLNAGDATGFNGSVHAGRTVSSTHACTDNQLSAVVSLDAGDAASALDRLGSSNVRLT